MTTKKEISKIARKQNKKIGKSAMKKIKLKLNKIAEELIKKSARNADFAGRKVIKEEDFED